MTPSRSSCLLLMCSDPSLVSTHIFHQVMSPLAHHHLSLGSSCFHQHLHTCHDCTICICIQLPIPTRGCTVCADSACPESLTLCHAARSCSSLHAPPEASFISFFVLFYYFSCLFVCIIPRSVASLRNCLRHCVLIFDALLTHCKNFHPLNPGLRDDRDDDHMNSSHLIRSHSLFPPQLKQRALSSSKRRPNSQQQ
jgi:hypothetical protein